MIVTVGSLFSGIGGLDLGIEAALVEAGLDVEVAWQVEQDRFCRKVLKKHWLNADRSIADVRKAGIGSLRRAHAIIGGFPCQDISFAGKGAGLAGERSGLWYEFARIIGEMEPRFVVVENVSALYVRGIDAVLGTLASLGYDARWGDLRASDVGAPHRRERVFIVAYTSGEYRGRKPIELHDRERTNCAWLGGELLDVAGDCCAHVAHSRSGEPQRRGEPGNLADEARRAQGEGDERQRNGDAAGGGGEVVAHRNGARFEGQRRGKQAGRPIASDHDPRQAESRMGGLSHGLSAGLDRHRWPAPPGEAQHEEEPPRTIQGRCDNRAAQLKAYGNAVCPQQALVIGRYLARLIKETAE